MSRLSRLDSIIKDNSELIEKIVLKRSRLDAGRPRSRSPEPKALSKPSPVGYLAISCDMSDLKENNRFAANSSPRVDARPSELSSAQQLNKWTARASEKRSKPQPAAGGHLGLRERRDLVKIRKQLN